MPAAKLLVLLRRAVPGPKNRSSPATGATSPTQLAAVSPVVIRAAAVPGACALDYLRTGGVIAAAPAKVWSELYTAVITWFRRERSGREGGAARAQGTSASRPSFLPGKSPCR